MSLLPNLTSLAAAHSTPELKWIKGIWVNSIVTFNDANGIVYDSVV